MKRILLIIILLIILLLIIILLILLILLLITHALENYRLCVRLCLLHCHLAEIQRMRFSDTNTYCAIKKDESRMRS